jgi:tyrosinase
VVSVTAMMVPDRAVTQAPLSYRKSADRLRGPQLEALRQAYSRSMALSDDRGFEFWAGLHGLPLPMYCEHHTELFLPWHRAYLYFFELSLKDQVPTVTLPWWDWTSAAAHQRGLPSSYVEPDGAGADSNPLAGGPISALARSQGEAAGLPAPERTVRFPDDPGMLPTRQHIADLLDLGDFLDFSQQLEQVHDQVHVWVGGTVAEIPYAAYDPIFWAHHAMIDRLWRLWQLRHPTAGVPGSLLSMALRPFPITVADTLSTTSLGYDYAVFSSRTVLGAQP